jgi:hypothetical protein
VFLGERVIFYAEGGDGFLFEIESPPPPPPQFFTDENHWSIN